MIERVELNPKHLRLEDQGIADRLALLRRQVLQEAAERRQQRRTLGALGVGLAGGERLEGGGRDRLPSVPVWALRGAAALLGKGDAVQRLCGNLQVDITKAREVLGWTPPVSVEEGLRQAVAGGHVP